MLAGGKLGRHPRLGEVIIDLADRDQVQAALGGAVKLYMEQGRPGERLGGMVERLGARRVRDIILGGN